MRGQGEKLTSVHPRRVPQGRGVDDTVRRMILDFPSLYQSRTAALHHLFCVLGSGWEWKYGQLVQEDYEEMVERFRREHPLIESPQELASYESKRLSERLNMPADGSLKGLSEEMSDYHRETAERNRRTRLNIDHIASVRAPLKRIYPMSVEYANLANIPDECESDWLDAAEEMALVVLEAPQSIDTEEDSLKGQAQNVQIANDALARIAHLRSTR